MKFEGLADLPAFFFRRQSKLWNPAGLRSRLTRKSVPFVAPRAILTALTFESTGESEMEGVYRISRVVPWNSIQPPSLLSRSRPQRRRRSLFQLIAAPKQERGAAWNTLVQTELHLGLLADTVAGNKTDTWGRQSRNPSRVFISNTQVQLRTCSIATKSKRSVPQHFVAGLLHVSKSGTLCPSHGTKGNSATCLCDKSKQLNR